MNNGEKTAFPFPNALEGGLTKREYFAAMAMQGMLSNPDATKETIKHKSSPIEVFPVQAVEFADELLKQLEICNPTK